MGVLIELIQNACNVLRGQGGTIVLQVEQKENLFALSVSDDGPGIPEGLRQDLFLQRVPSNGGLGLGLFLSNKVIQALGGSLEFQTSAKGTTFTILLPLAEDAQKAP